MLFAFFYKSNLTIEQLSDTYINEESMFITLDNGASVHYRDEGNKSGKTIVLIHGGLGSLHNFDGWIPLLEDDYRIISMDLLGHGLTGTYPANVYDRNTERDMIHMLLQAIGVEKYTIAGNSWGGGIALEMVLAYPKEVEGLILIDSEGIPNSEDGYDESLFSGTKVLAPDDPDFTTLSVVEKTSARFIGPAAIKMTLQSMIYNDDLLTKDFVDYFGRILRYDKNREAQLLMFPQGLYLMRSNPEDLKPRLPEIECPTLIMTGDNDTLVPMYVNKTFNEKIENSYIVIVEESGHLPMIEQPEQSATYVIEFMENIIN